MRLFGRLTRKSQMTSAVLLAAAVIGAPAPYAFAIHMQPLHEKKHDAKRQVEAMFQEEKAFLKPLPLEGFRYFKEGTRTVQDDGCVQVDESWYAARPARIGTDVLVRVYEKELEIRDIHTLALIRRHNLTLKRGDVVLPDSERIFNPSRQTRQILGALIHDGHNSASRE